MSGKINLSKLKSDRVPLKKGKYKSRILKIIDLGVQAGFKPGDASNRQLLVSFECSTAKITTSKGELPRVETKFIPVKGGDRAMLTLLVDAVHGVNPNDFAIEELLNQPVKFKQDTHEMAPDKLAIRGFEEIDEEILDKMPPLIGDSFFFEFDNPSKAALEKLSEFELTTIAKALNYPGSKVEKMIEGGSSSPEIQVTDPDPSSDDIDGVFDDEDEVC